MMLWANLFGTYFDVADAQFFGSWEPGDQVGVTYRVTNGGDFATGTGFSIAFFLSQDEFIGDFSDFFLGSSQFDFSLFAGNTTFNQFFSASLPDASSFFWNGSETYYIGMVIDPFNGIFEDFEFDNSNLGIGWDSDQIDVSSSQSAADLQSTSLFTSAIGAVSPGTNVSLTNQIENNGLAAAPPYSVAYYLSRDPIWDTSDTLLRQDSDSGIDPFSESIINTTVTLPSNGAPVYQQGGSQYYILSVIDPQNQLAESDETNNSGRGVGLDAAPVTIQVTTTPGGDDLPPTNFPPGKLTAVYFDTMIKLYQQLDKSYTAAAAKSGSVVNLNPMVTRIRQTLQALLTLRTELKAVKYTGTVQLGNGAVWNADTVEFLERVLVKAFVTNSPRAAKARAARENPISTYLKPAIKGVQSLLRDATTAFFKTATGFAAVGIAASLIPGGQPVAAFAAQGAVVAGTLGVMSYLGLQAISQADKALYGEVSPPEQRVVMDDAAAKSSAASQEIPDSTPLGNALQNLSDANNSYNDQWNHETYEDIDAKFDELFAKLSNNKPGNDPDPDPDPGDDNDLGGRYKGTYHYQINLSNGGQLAEDAPMSLSLRPNASGQLEGKVKAPFLVYDPNTLNVRSRGRINGEFTAQVIDGMLMGNVSYKTPNGTITSTLTWTIEPDGSLRGKPSDNTESDSFFDLRPV